MHVVRWLILAACLAAGLAAQHVVAGTITGTITDPDGRPVPRIAAQAANLADKTVYRATSSEVGAYSIEKLPAGRYQLTAQCRQRLSNRLSEKTCGLCLDEQSNSTFGCRKA